MLIKRLALTVLLVCAALSAHAQVTGTGVGPVNPGLLGPKCGNASASALCKPVPAVVAPLTCALDGISPAPTNTFSAFRLIGTYAGHLYQIQRTSDNATLNIDAQAGSCLPDTSGVASFCAATTCGRSAWYDQIGSVTFTQSTVANQFRENSTGINSKPAIDNSVALNSSANMVSGSNNDLMCTGNCSVMVVMFDPSSGIPDGGWIGNTNGNSPYNGWNFGPSTQAQAYKTVLYNDGNWNNGGNCNQTVVVDNAIHLAGFIRTGTSAVCYIDGTTNSAQTMTTVTNSGVPAIIGGGSWGGGTNTGLIGEIVIWNGTAISGANYTSYRTTTQSRWATQ